MQSFGAAFFNDLKCEYGNKDADRNDFVKIFKINLRKKITPESAYQSSLSDHQNLFQNTPMANNEYQLLFYTMSIDV